ncbi:putative F-box protein At1g47300 [Panicum virgatum]|uniref:putative F-box protein At1g47300 n=1 Tax=Panicum virgatum TaxID=38727 RepID=UPI0019D65143|nr:putative F-box protein At1g47300 [Panicum virgatum]
MEVGATAAAYLPDDLVVDILARLPAKSLCRFKCVSRRWRALISDKFSSAAQTLSGFFVSRAPAWRFTVLPSSVTPPGGGTGGLPPVDASLSFLPPSCVEGEIKMLDSCNWLLLLLCSEDERPCDLILLVAPVCVA